MPEAKFKITDDMIDAGMEAIIALREEEDLDFDRSKMSGLETMSLRRSVKRCVQAAANKYLTALWEPATDE